MRIVSAHNRTIFVNAITIIDWGSVVSISDNSNQFQQGVKLSLWAKMAALPITILNVLVTSTQKALQV